MLTTFPVVLQLPCPPTLLHSLVPRLHAEQTLFAKNRTVPALVLALPDTLAIRIRVAVQNASTIMIAHGTRHA